MRVFRSVVLSVILLASLAAQSQSVSSVYSNNGIGLLNYQGLPHNVGMGEVGTGLPTIWNLNYNPAFLPFNSLTIYQVGVEMDRRKISTNTLDGKKVAGGLKSLNLAFPVISGKWTTAVSVSPYSTSNYASFSQEQLSPDILGTTTYTGEGGLSSISWAHGISIGSGIYAGLKYNIMFGSIQNEESTIVESTNPEEPISTYETTLVDRTSYSGSKFDLSLGYRREVGGAKNKMMNFGLIYEISHKIDGLKDQWEFTNAVDKRYLFEDQSLNFYTPNILNLGWSYQILNKLSVGTDIVFTKWSQDQLDNERFRNTTKFSLGVERIPDISSVNNYWKRVTYRAGVNFGPLPYTINNNTINEFGINFGGSLPFGYSKLDLAFKYGRVGTLNNDLVRETYFRIVLGASINDRWFVKRRYD